MERKLIFVFLTFLATWANGDGEGEENERQGGRGDSQTIGIAVHNDGLSYLGLFKSAGTMISHGHDHEKRDTAPPTSQQTSYYFLSQNSAAHFTAERDCKDYLGDEATLLYIETQEEMKAVQKFLADSDDTGATYWVGGKFDFGKKQFVWGNLAEIGTPEKKDRPWAPWLEGHPNTRTAVTRVSVQTPGVRFHAGLRFKTQMQTVSNRYICELKVGNPEEEALPCYKNNDLIVVADSSEHVSKAGYVIVLELITRLGIAWGDNPGNHFGVVVTAEGGQNVHVLNDSANVAELRDSFFKTPHLGGKAAISEGIAKALAEFHKTDKNNVVKNLVILTASHIGTNAADDWHKIQQAGVHAFAIGIGAEVTKPELLTVTGNRGDCVFPVETFDKAMMVLQGLSRKICEYELVKDEVGPGHDKYEPAHALK